MKKFGAKKGPYGYHILVCKVDMISPFKRVEKKCFDEYRGFQKKNHTGKYMPHMTEHMDFSASLISTPTQYI